MAISPDDLYVALEDFVMRLMTLAEADGMDAMVELDLSFSQARMLFLLAHQGEPMPIHAIATKLGLSDAATGRNVEQLLKLEVVERRESPADRRVKLVSLTPIGEKLSTQHIDCKRESIKAFTADLPEDQRDNLHRALSDILAGDTLRRQTH
ncbi:MarR family winged helix-turn-helix transcriptional regulator [Aeromicrobium ginsengisoli]|nr:MarR family transcriptional regulator [Aeromicrobium ginsengisoli]